ncbi:MAG: FAD-dependent oxidoreductase [Coriobacteriia bacterium]|nr:FAD-dependent oxidoreductase [Coriobacteriia bacterium]
MKAGTHSVRLLRREDICDDVALFSFSRPKEYAFAAGQYLRLHLEPSEGPSAKPFSHCSAPGDEAIEITTRLSGSPFKRALAGLQPGGGVRVSGPMGHFLLPDPPPKVVFLVGGIGITPVRSMIRDAVARSNGLDAVLVYGNRSPACVPFRSEFEGLEEYGIRVLHVFEQAGEDWRGETGFISAAVVRNGVPDSASRLFVTAGPPVMVEAMEMVLNQLSVDEERRLVERFGTGPRT